jgi:uncharacterized protein (DUF58 family)
VNAVRRPAARTAADTRYRRSSQQQPWRPTVALVRAVAVGGGCLALAVVLGRADLAAIAAPVVLATLAALTLGGRLRSAAPSVDAALRGAPSGGEVAEVTLHGPAVPGAQLLTVAVPHATRLGDAFTEVLDGPVPRTTRSTRLPDWGPVVLARPDVLAVGPDALWRCGPVGGEQLDLLVPPTVHPVDPLPLAPISAGWAGDHESRRPGTGGELIDLREYRAGDRLRSISWRAFARHQQLYVRRTRSDADADIVLVVDTRVDVVPQRPRLRGWSRTKDLWRQRFRRWGAALVGMVRSPDATAEPAVEPVSSLDLGVRAAAAIAEAQARIGDRVGVLDLGRQTRGVRLGAGARHLDRLRSILGGLDLQPWQPLSRVEYWGLPAGAVVVYLSPLIDEAGVQAGVDIRSRGHQVLVVDTLPENDLRAVAAPDRAATAEVGILLAERAARLQPLRDRAIPVVPWQLAGSGSGAVAEQLELLRRARFRR